MSRTQQKLQAMSAQERLIQEKKRLIEEKLRLDNAKKYPNSGEYRLRIENIRIHLYSCMKILVIQPPNTSQK